VWIGVLANGINALFNWALIFAAGWGIVGAPWATTITRTMEFLLILLYIYVKKNALRDTLPIFSRENLTQSVLKPFWKLAISGALSITAEAWSFEITTILAGLLGTVALDAHIITLTIATFLFLSFPFAIGIAASIRVGQLIGNFNSKDAKRSSHSSYVLSIITQAVLIAILLPLKDVLGHLFSSDDDVANLVSELIPISCAFMIGDSFQATTGGVLRGLGRQKLVLWLNLLGFWVLAVPIGAILAFAVDLGVFGLWWGMVIGIYLSAFIGLWSLRRVNWEHEAKKTLKRLSTIVSTRQIIDPDGTSPAENVIDSGEVS
jgi:MATE family multidrug resistance protein